MALWIEVKVRHEETLDSGKTVKVTDPYLVDATGCTEAEARIVEEITPFTNEFNVLSVGKTKISDIFWDASGDRFYKVKANYVTLDEKTGVEKRIPFYTLVQASSFAKAFYNFNKGMEGAIVNYEIEVISETKYMDAFRYKSPRQ